MIRTLLYALGGVLLGAVIHIVVILLLPTFASNDVWSRVSTLVPVNSPVVLPGVAPGEPNPLRLDPELAYVLCRLDLSQGPGVVSGAFPAGYWSVAVFDRSGAVVYSTTNRDGIGQALELGLFNAAQTRMLAEQQLDIAEGLLIVETRSDEVFAVVRLAPPHQAMRARFEAALGQLVCGNIS